MAPDSSLQKLLPEQHPAARAYSCNEHTKLDIEDETQTWPDLESLLRTTWEQTGKINENELSAVQVAQCNLPGEADGTTAGCLIYLAPIWHEARSTDAPAVKHMVLWGNEGRAHRGSVWIWHKQFLDGSADLQVYAEGRRKSTVTQVPNLWVQRGSSRKPGKRLIGSHYREAPRRMDQLGYLVLPIGLGIKEQLNRESRRRSAPFIFQWVITSDCLCLSFFRVSLRRYRSTSSAWRATKCVWFNIFKFSFSFQVFCQ